MTQEGFNEQMDNAVKGAILKAMEDDPDFRQKMAQLITKKDDTDKDIEVDIGLPVTKVADNEMKYFIATGKRVNQWSRTPIQSISLSKNLLINLYTQLDKLVREGYLK